MNNEKKENKEDKTPFSNLINSYDLEKDLQDAYDKKFHFHWIAYSHTFLDELMKSFVFIFLNSKIGLAKIDVSKDFKDYIHRLTYYRSLSLLHFNGIIDLELYDNLKEINSNRNKILHRLIMNIEDINKINLKEYFNLCNSSIKKLIGSLLDYVKFTSISQEIFLKSFNKLENKIKQKEKEDETKNKIQTN